MIVFNFVHKKLFRKTKYVKIVIKIVKFAMEIIKIVALSKNINIFSFIQTKKQMRR